MTQLKVYFRTRREVSRIQKSLVQLDAIKLRCEVVGLWLTVGVERKEKSERLLKEKL